MPDASSSSPSGRVAVLAESFLDRYRKGERPALAEYTDRYPELADEIRLVFPAMVEMERLGPLPGAGEPTGPFADGGRPTARRSARSATTGSSARSAAAAWASSTRPSRRRWAGTWP